VQLHDLARNPVNVAYQNNSKAADEETRSQGIGTDSGSNTHSREKLSTCKGKLSEGSREKNITEEYSKSSSLSGNRSKPLSSSSSSEAAAAGGKSDKVERRSLMAKTRSQQTSSGVHTSRKETSQRGRPEKANAKTTDGNDLTLRN